MGEAAPATESVQPGAGAPRKGRNGRSARQTPHKRPEASITRFDEARSRRERGKGEHAPAKAREEPARPHLPAFLLRPVRAKA
jgi:hypothetical protein